MKPRRPRMATALLASSAAAAAVLLAAALWAPDARADGHAVAIETSREVYYYGDHLSFTVTVPGGGGGGGVDTAHFYIKHENGRASSAIPIRLAGEQTVSTSPFPFEPPPKGYPDLPYPTGQYTLRIEYGGSEAEASFALRDSGRIVIPVWIKDVTRLWVADQIDDATYAMSIEYLISSGIIAVPLQGEGGEAAAGGGGEGGNGGGGEGPVAIPAWIKQSASWWVDGAITGDEYGRGLEYLIRSGVVVV